MMPSHITDNMTDEQVRLRLEHKYARRRIVRQLWAEQHRALNPRSDRHP